MKTIEDLKAAYAAATPGEWKANGFTDDGWEVYADEYGLLLETYDRDVGINTGEANAHLIALMHNALPALIECAEALRGLTTVCDAGQSADYRALQELRTMREARAALAKLENAR